MSRKVGANATLERIFNLRIEYLVSKIDKLNARRKTLLINKQNIEYDINKYSHFERSQHISCGALYAQSVDFHAKNMRNISTDLNLAEEKIIENEILLKRAIMYLSAK